MSLQSIRNLNLLATLAVGYIGLTASIHKESIYLAELKECSNGETDNHDKRMNK